MKAAQLTATKGFETRGLFLWMARATSSLPVPVSPVMRTVALVGATRAIICRSSENCGTDAEDFAAAFEPIDGESQ